MATALSSSPAVQLSLKCDVTVKTSAQNNSSVRLISSGRSVFVGQAVRCTEAVGTRAAGVATRVPLTVRATSATPSTSTPSSTATLDRPWKTSDCRLVLEDGSVWKGKAFGARGTQAGEVVFNTSLTGYQEILTDPSYAGQFVLMTVPHIGNTGVNFGDEESSTCFLSGLVIRNLSTCVSNWRSSQTLPDYLKQRNIMGITDLDTRAITKRLRDKGSLNGVLSTDASKTDEELLEAAKNFSIVGKDLISSVSCDAPYVWEDKTGEAWEFSPKVRGEGEPEFNIVAYDFGVKHNILRRLASYGCKITVVPSTYPAEEVLKLNPDGVLFSNGPGDPSAVPYAVDRVSSLVGRTAVLGVCMGHQLLGQALGGATFKMKYGHHGGNHPVRQTRTGRVEISAQNHNYAVDPASLPSGVEITHINLNDGTCAGLYFPSKKAMSIQYHPEASPGPHDSDPVFYDFIELMRRHRSEK